MNITIPFRHAEITSSTSGWSKPESRMRMPMLTMLQVTRK